MNTKHSFALLLFAGGTILILVGCTFTGLGLFTLVSSKRGRSDITWAVTAVGGLVLAMGLASVLLGVRIYRRSDHQLEEVRDKNGMLATKGFPWLSPINIFLYIISSILFFMVVQYGVDFKNPKEIRFFLGFALLTVVMFVAALRAAHRHFFGRPTVPKVEESRSTKSEERKVEISTQVYDQ